MIPTFRGKGADNNGGGDKIAMEGPAFSSCMQESLCMTGWMGAGNAVIVSYKPPEMMSRALNIDF